MMGSMMTGMGLAMAVLTLLALALLVLAVLAGIWLIRSMRATHGGRNDRSQVVAILQRRYAAGEIDEEEYRRRLHTITLT